MSSAPFIGKSLWGVCEAGDVSKWDDLFARIKAEGYFAVETICHFDLNLDPAKFRECLDKNNLELVIQIHTASDWSKFDYCTSCELDDHLQSFRQLVVDALVHSPNMINCHSGHDSWDVPTAVDYFRQVLAIEQELLVGKYADVVLVHETHRQRLLSNPYVTRDILSSPHLSALKVNCDLSHWVCVCEKLFDPENHARDKWWPEVLKLVASHCHLIHLRVGHPQGPQVPDLSENYRGEIDTHLSWWNEIFEEQRRLGIRHRCITEHGPEPYQVFLGASRAATEEVKSSALWTINAEVKALVLERVKIKI